MLNTKLKLKKGKKGLDKDLFFCLAMIAIPVIQFIIFYVIVNFNSFLMAFQEATENYGKIEYAFLKGRNIFANFERLWKELTLETNMRSALGNTFLVWFLTTIVGSTLCVIFSYYIFKKGWGSTTFRLILFLPTILPGMLLGAIFQTFMDTIIPSLMDRVPLFALGEGTAFPTAMFFIVWFSFGSQILIYNGTMSQISPSVIESAQLDGATPLIELWKIVLPEIMPAVGTFLIVGIAGLFTNQANLFGFHGTGAKDYEGEYTIGYWMYVQTLGTETEYPYISTFGLCCTLIVLPMTWGVKKLVNKIGD